MNRNFQLKITAQNIGPESGGVVTPLWVSTHDGSFDTFNFGEEASSGIEFIAEDAVVGLEGTVPNLVESLVEAGLDPANVPPQDETLAGIFENSEAASNGGSQGIILSSIFGLLPGQTSSTFLALGDNPGEQNRYFSFGSMFFPSNDAFIGNENPFEIELFDETGNFIGADFIIGGDQVWDAGTEVNDENFSFIPFSPDVLLEGVTESGTVQQHPGLNPLGSGGVLDFPGVPFDNADFQTTNEQILQIKIEKVPVTDPFEFRTIDGADNNDNKGATNNALVRLFDPAFEDGFKTPRGGNFDESNLPNPRSISNIVNDERAPIINNLNASNWLWQWGQFLDHDLDLNEANDNNPPAPGDRMPIEVPNGDPTFADITELPFIRVPAANETGTGPNNPRTTVNQITAFIDASNVYGSDEERADFLRNRSTGQGLLKTSLGNTGEESLLPLNDGTQENATGGTLGDLQFVAGDIRANEQLGLTAVHTLLVRDHNKIASELYNRISTGEEVLAAKLETFRIENPLLSSEDTLDEFIYQSARKVVGAKVQAITYNEFLPLLIGKNTLQEYEGYDVDINPQISTEFANAAYRLGHTLINNQIRKVDADGVREESLVNSFFNPQSIIDNGVDNLLTGLSFQGAQEVDNQLVDGVRNFLFPAGGGGLDLAAVNIARGRDVGLPSYTEVYQQIFGEDISSFSDLGSQGLGLFRNEVVTLFEKAYDSVDQIDLWVGGISERPDEQGGLLGPTLSFIVADQFSRTRDGDEFFYLREDELDDLQLLSPDIAETTLANLIRDNSDETYLVPEDAFVVPFDNSIFGDNSENTLKGTKQNDLIDGSAGNDQIFGRGNDDHLFGGAGNDVVYGGRGADKIFGSEGVDVLTGNSGHDTIVGGFGNDIAFGGQGDDLLEGQAGSDFLNSGPGKDTFVFRSDLLNDGFQDVDQIVKFSRHDTLDVSDYLGSGGEVTFTRVQKTSLIIDLSGEDQINVFGNRQALNLAEQQLSIS